MKFAKPRFGFSLVEVMVALVIFALISLALTRTIHFALQSAHRNVIKNTAFTTAQSYLEQIKAMEDADLISAVSAGDPLRTRQLSALADQAVNAGAGLSHWTYPSLDGEAKANHHRILLDYRKDRDGNAHPVYMDMELFLFLEPLPGGQGWSVKIEYTYESIALRGGASGTQSVRVIRSRRSGQA